MSRNLEPATPSRKRFSTSKLSSLFRMTFISGPILLFTTRISAKSASMMILLSAPALLLALLLTVPSLLFNSPDQNAYYEFANLVNRDPSQLVILGLATVCSIIALAIPATAPTPFTAVRS